VAEDLSALEDLSDLLEEPREVVSRFRTEQLAAMVGSLAKGAPYLDINRPTIRMQARPDLRRHPEWPEEWYVRVPGTPVTWNPKEARAWGHAQNVVRVFPSADEAEAYAVKVWRKRWKLSDEADIVCRREKAYGVYASRPGDLEKARKWREEHGLGDVLLITHTDPLGLEKALSLMGEPPPLEPKPAPSLEEEQAARVFDIPTAETSIDDELERRYRRELRQEREESPEEYARHLAQEFASRTTTLLREFSRLEEDPKNRAYARALSQAVRETAAKACEDSKLVRDTFPGSFLEAMKVTPTARPDYEDAKRLEGLAAKAAGLARLLPQRVGREEGVRLRALVDEWHADAEALLTREAGVYDVPLRSLSTVRVQREGLDGVLSHHPGEQALEAGLGRKAAKRRTVSEAPKEAPAAKPPTVQANQAPARPVGPRPLTPDRWDIWIVPAGQGKVALLARDRHASEDDVANMLRRLAPETGKAQVPPNPREWRYWPDPKEYPIVPVGVREGKPVPAPRPVVVQGATAAEAAARIMARWPEAKLVDAGPVQVRALRAFGIEPGPYGPKDVLWHAVAAPSGVAVVGTAWCYLPRDGGVDVRVAVQKGTRKPLRLPARSPEEAALKARERLMSLGLAADVTAAVPEEVTKSFSRVTLALARRGDMERQRRPADPLGALWSLSEEEREKALSSLSPAARSVALAAGAGLTPREVATARGEDVEDVRRRFALAEKQIAQHVARRPEARMELAGPRLSL
jgi:hypothetical protein